MIVSLTQKKSIIHELYDTLEKLRYPEVAEVRFEEFEDTILTGTKRINLLHWIIQNSPDFTSSILSNLKDDALSDKLVKCYSQIGLCNDENVLLGKCAIDKQLQFLSLLTLFMKHLHLADSVLLKDDKEITNNLIKIDTVPFTSESYQHIKSINDNKENKIDCIKTEVLGSPKPSENELLNENSNLDELSSNIKEKELNENKIGNYEHVLQNFNTAFKEVISLPTQDKQSDIFSESYSDFSSNLQDICSTFSVINKTLINEDKLKNRPKLEHSKKLVKPLSQAVTNSLVLIEQACNMFNELQIITD